MGHSRGYALILWWQMCNDSGIMKTKFGLVQRGRNGFVKGVVDLNIHNNQLHGFPRGGMGILDSDIMARATEVICKWIQF